MLKAAVEAINTKLAGGASREAWELAGLARVEPTLSFDNPRVHGGPNRWIEIMNACRLSKEQRFLLPPYSPDMHRVIEHTHARLVSDFQGWLNTHVGDFDLPAYKAKLQELFYERQTADVIAADVSTLPALYGAIIRAEGAWPPKSFR